MFIILCHIIACIVSKLNIFGGENRLSQLMRVSKVFTKFLNARKTNARCRELCVCMKRDRMTCEYMHENCHLERCSANMSKPSFSKNPKSSLASSSLDANHCLMANAVDLCLIAECVYGNYFV